MACIDGLSGFAEAIHAAYPQTSVQLCIVHLVRAALRYVSDQDSKAVVARPEEDLSGGDGDRSRAGVGGFRSSVGREVSDDQQDVAAKWADIVTLFDFPPAIRKAIYTTNAIESVNSVIRKFTRNRKIYPNEESALKMIYMAIREASQRWTMPVRHWKEALNHFAIMFEGRLPELTSK